ncbi:MAG: pyridoxamine 5'-phosphate oxidase family protein [Acidimicrobiia bacterium]
MAGKVVDGISPELAAFLAAQPVFFVATAPLAAGGHVNVSPKGLDTFAVLDEHTVAYLDLTGSGIETIAHLRENGRVTVMCCAFEGRPKVVRLHGRGEVVTPGDAAFAALRARFGEHPGVRAVIRIAVERVSTSCGFGVPLMEYRGDRSEMDEWVERKGADRLEDYRRTRNAASIDGLPGWPPENR